MSVGCSPREIRYTFWKPLRRILLTDEIGREERERGGEERVRKEEKGKEERVADGGGGKERERESLSFHLRAPLESQSCDNHLVTSTKRSKRIKESPAQRVDLLNKLRLLTTNSLSQVSCPLLQASLSQGTSDPHRRAVGRMPRLYGVFPQALKGCPTASLLGLWDPVPSGARQPELAGQEKVLSFCLRWPEV